MVAVALAACARAPAADSPDPPPDLPLEIAGFASTTTTVLATGDVASEAVEAGDLTDLLDAAGFESGVRRSYAGRGLRIRRLEVRVLRFASASGAASYLEWVLGHVPDLIGEATPSTGPPVRGVPLFVHVPDACCPREPAVTLAAWRRERDVVRVVVAGPAADGPRAAELIGDVYAAIPGGDGA